MNPNSYVVLFANKKPEDNVIIKNMFNNCLEIGLGWIDIDFNNNMKLIDEYVKNNDVSQFIFSGFEIGWDKLVIALKGKYPDKKIKVICNTNDSLLYYEYERNNFFKLLELSKENVVDDIAFFRKSQYETYKNLGYKCSHLVENYSYKGEAIEISDNEDNKIKIGIYPLNYTWDKNIFNQLCIAKFVENSCVYYNKLDERMTDFLDTMKIVNVAEKIENVNEKDIANLVKNKDVIISTSFTEYVHPVFFISMELGVPCLIGNNSDMFDDVELSKYVVSKAEDNPIENAKMVDEILNNKEKIRRLYTEWKEKYDVLAKESMEKFLNK